MPSWVRDEATWEKAKAAARKQYPDAEDDKFYAIVTSIYKKMGGKIGGSMSKAIIFLKAPLEESS